MTETTARAATVHVLKVTLRNVRPPVWRRLEVPSAATLGQLHHVLQLAFGWRDDHLHDFMVRGVRYTPTSEEYDSLWGASTDADEDAAPLARVVPRPGDAMEYTYDFGDDWRHRIEVESVRPAEPGVRRPRCTGGAGLPPEEDLGTVRAGRFDEAARAGVDERLARLAEVMTMVPGRSDPAADPVLVGVFPALDGGGRCPCGCGEQVALPGDSLPALRPAPPAELAALAEQTVLVRRCVALAGWLGAGRPLTPSRLLKPADALRAQAELDLDTPLLPRRDERDDAAPADDRVPSEARPEARSDAAGGSDPDLFAAAGIPLTSDRALPPGRPGAPVRKIRSAKDLRAVHLLWTACLDARLIDIRGGKACPGPGLAVWRDAATPAARIESWTTLLAGYLRAATDAYAADRGLFGPVNGQVLQSSAPLLYSTAGAPVPLIALALTLAEIGQDDGDGQSVVDQFLVLPQLAAAVATAVEDWSVTGVLTTARLPEEAAAAVAAEAGAFNQDLRRELAGLAEDPDGADLAPLLQESLTGVVRQLVDGPAIAVTPLGHYGLGRLLQAHGWQVPVGGACRDLEPAALLDELVHYLPADVEAEAADWLAARGEGWSDMLREVMWSAAVGGEDGPVRRGALPMVLRAAGHRVVPLLDAAQADPWLGAVVAEARAELGLGPELSLTHRLWLAVDELTLLLEAAEDREEAQEALDGSGLADLLREPGGVEAAVAARHPQTPQVLRAATVLLDDPELKRSLVTALNGRHGPSGGSRRRRPAPRRGRRDRRR